MSVAEAFGGRAEQVGVAVGLARLHPDDLGRTAPVTAVCNSPVYGGGIGLVSVMD
jgi:hypothetical protein